MELAKITSKGQITIPVGIRRKMGVKSGDKVLFVEDNGRVIMMNASLHAIWEAQKAMEGAAEELGLTDMDDVVALVKEMRRGRERAE